MHGSLKDFLILSSLPMIVEQLHMTCTYRVGEHFTEVRYTLLQKGSMVLP
jgi:hypothetical protein